MAAAVLTVGDESQHNLLPGFLEKVFRLTSLNQSQSPSSFCFRWKTKRGTFFSHLVHIRFSSLHVSDYELQVSLSEALCRLTPRRDREQRANQWFSICDISKAFCDIRDADFEVDCRRFLNFVNSYHGDQRRVYTFPCLRAFLNSTQLFRPKDDKLDDFWIDFNVGSGCVSFFIDDPQGFLWGSIHLLKEEVDHYSLQLKHDDTVLTVRLKNPIMHHNSRGQTVELSFNCVHHRELEKVAGRTFKKTQSSPRTAEVGGTDQACPSAQKCNVQSYCRKKPPSKSHLKILPLSSPSSEEDSFLSKATIKSRAEILFDQIRSSTPAFDSGFQSPFDLADVSILKTPSDSVQPEPGTSEVVELQIPQEETVEAGGRGNSPTKKEVLRKREAPDSGYLSDQSEGAPPQKKKMELQQDGDESSLALTEKPEEGVVGEGVRPVDQKDKEGAEPESYLTSEITAAFKTFKAQLEQHFTGCWKKVEAEVLLSLKECQRHVSSLLTAVHRHRLLLLQQFESSVTDQLKHLEETSAHLNSMNTQILSFFQSEMQRFGSFCEEHLEKLKSLESERVEHPSSQ
ncbi:uncharacterized protein [Leuresthes tenuis]|uniref:uncharacterized protein n=1 Tax=Leuresthes tenuis TaxID=355514 RepID=UPI003B50E928